MADRDACRAESAVRAQEISNCRAQAAAETALADERAAALQKLNQAVAEKDQILARREAEFRAQLTAARGTFRSRFERALELLGVGVALGLAAR